MVAYVFRTIFALAVDSGEVRRAIMEPERWLPSWDRVHDLRRIADGDADGVGRRYRTTVRAAAPYALTWHMQVTRADPQVVIWAASGDLEGWGRWDLRQRGARAEVMSTWRVRTTRWWMNLLAPVARPLFVRNHDAVMHQGAQQLAAHLGTQLVAYHGSDLARPRRFGDPRRLSGSARAGHHP